MIQQDTILQLQDTTQQLIHNSVKVLSPDSLAKLDSLVRLDSLAVVDSLKRVDSLAVVHAPRGFIGISHPSLPQTESWVFVTLLILFFLLIFSISRSRGLIPDTVKTFFQVKDRSSIFRRATISDLRFRLFLILFSIGVLSLYSYLTFYQPQTEFSFKKYTYFLLTTIAFFGFKSLTFDLLGYVFLDASSLKMGKDSYFNILSFLGIILFPFLILHIYIPFNYINIIEVISLIIAVGFFILVIIKLFQIFFHKLVASFYILLYLCTLEILPLIALFQVYQLLM